jgi:hypothetical protein
MKINCGLDNDEMIAAVGEYLRRGLSTLIVVDQVVAKDDGTWLIKARDEQSAPRGKTDCRNCGERGHNAKTCPVPVKSAVVEVDEQKPE